MEADLYTYITSDSAFQALAGDRLYPVTLPQDVTYPAAKYQRISAPRDREVSRGPTGRVMARIQFDCWADSPDTARSLFNVIRRRLDGYMGRLGSTSIGNISIEDDRDDYEEGPGAYGVSFDAIITYRED